MNRKTIIIYIISTCIFFSIGFIIDGSYLQQITDKLNNFSSNYPQEKVHIQTDKPYYIAGEEIWVKAYLITAYDNQPSEFSKILYVELINEANEISKKITLAADSGRAFGQLTLPDNLSSGNYRLRAYTNYMRNFDNDFFFEKSVSITNIAEAAKRTTDDKINQELAVQFFPEGGDLIYGIRAKVGIKVVNQNGLGVNLSGYIIDNNQEKVAMFTAEHAGIGSFALNPTKGKNYKAVIEKADGSKHIYNLPKILESGYGLSINNLSDKKTITLKMTASQQLINGQELNLVAQSNGKIYFTTTAKMDNAVLTTNIPKSRFPTGIIQFTLFEGNIPRAERLIFNNQNDQIIINITENKIAGTENKTKLSLMVTDENENPISGNFSVAVVDAEKVLVNEDDETTIISNLLLSSDLKGYIEQPNYYFNNSNADKERQLDNLLLTQGWRRFVWKDLIAGKELAITNTFEKSVTISGLVTNLNNKPIANAKVNLMSTSPGFDMLLDTLTDAYGRFTFDRLDISDTLNFILHAKDGNNKEVKVVVDNSPKIAIRKPESIKDDMASYVTNAKKLQEEISRISPAGIKLNQVTITSKKELKPIQNIANSQNRNGSADYVIPKEKFTHQTGDAFNVFYWVPGVKIQDEKIIRAKSTTVSLAPKLMGKPQPMLIILDGIALQDQDLLKRIPASTIEGIEVLTSNYNTVMYEDGYWGVILITTKRGGPEKIEKSMSTNLAKVSNKGLTLIKEFYVPENPKQQLTNSLAKLINDKRTTIYWNPNVNSNDNGKVTILLQNNMTTKYRVTIEGMDVYGKFGRKVFTYTNL